jgi:integrase
VVEVSRGQAHGTSATLADLIERWLDHVEADLSPKTLVEYQRVIDGRILPGLGNIKLRRLLTSDLESFYLQLSKQGLAPATVRRAHNIIRTALGQGLRWGWVTANPVANASPPSVPRPDIRPPDPATVLVLLDAARAWDVDFGDCLHLAAATGARRSELCGLRWDNIDLEAGQILIDRAIIETGSTLYEKDTKTHAARRIAVDTGTLLMLGDRLDRRQQASAALGMDWYPAGFVFSDDPGGATPWRPGRITLAFIRLCRRAQIDDVLLHDLRHFSATRLLASGIDVRTVAGRLGHANAATTLAVYSHFVDAVDRRAATVFGDLITRTSEPSS